MSSTWARISSSWASVIPRPKDCSASAKAIHSFRQVENLCCSEKMRCISRLAYRVEKGLWKVSWPLIGNVL